jgi:rare lipoprotein A
MRGRSDRAISRSLAAGWACSSDRSLAGVGPVPLIAPTPDQIYRETGIASWYGKEFHGNKTASGEVFDMNGFSAAHRTLPLGTTIRVTNLDNFKSIKVTINDRGPSDKGRSLDLSGAAKSSYVGHRR